MAHLRIFCSAVILLSLTLVSQAETPAGYTQFGGPGGNFHVSGLPARLGEPKKLWTVPAKIDASDDDDLMSYGPVVADPTIVIVPDHDGKNDYWRALNPADGSEVWTFTLPNGRKMEFGASPRSTPLLHEGIVYGMSAWGVLFALDRESGKPVWQVDVVKQYSPAKPPIWGYSSALLLGSAGLVINPGGGQNGLVCLDPKTGALLWSAETDVANYTSFLFAEFGGVKQVIGYDATSLRGWDEKTGKELWKLQYESSNGYIVPTPVQVGDKLLITDDDIGSRLFAFKDGILVPKPVADNIDLLSELTTSVVLDGVAYLVFYELIAADAKTLKILWRNDELDAFAASIYAFIFADEAAKRLLIFTSDGSLSLAEVSASGGEVLTSHKLTGKTKAGPALVGNRFYGRDAKSIYAYEVW